MQTLYIDHFFVNLDLFLSFILCVIYLFNMGLIKNTDNIFASIFFCIFINIFISSLLLTQQIYLGEMILTSIMFLFVLIFFLFFIDKHIYVESLDLRCFSIVETVLYSIVIFISGVLLIFSFVNGEKFKLAEERVDSNESLLIPGHEIHNYIKDTYSGGELATQTEKTPEEKIKEKKELIYQEKLSYLNENKFFQRFTDIIVIYLGVILILFFFNWKREEEGGYYYDR